MKWSLSPILQRRDYAEKVAVAFWRAMGGAEDELEDSDEAEGENAGG